MAKSMFDDIGSAAATFAANYESPGRYYEFINAVKEIETRKGEAALVLEKKVIIVLDDDDGKGHRAGEEVSHMMMQKHDSFLGNVKAMLIGIMGLEDPDEIPDAEWMETCQEMVGEEQPLAGRFVECVNVNRVTKAGGDFTAISYVQQLSPREVHDELGEGAEKFFTAERWEQMIKEYEA